MWNCKFSFNCLREGYTKSCPNTHCRRFQRSPVDNIYRQPDLKVPFDSYSEERRQNAGELFMQYENNWQGCSQLPDYLPNDEKTRFDLAEEGEFKARRKLVNMRHPRHQSLDYYPIHMVPFGPMK